MKSSDSHGPFCSLKTHYLFPKNPLWCRFSFPLYFLFSSDEWFLFLQWNLKIAHCFLVCCCWGCWGCGGGERGWTLSVLCSDVMAQCLSLWWKSLQGHQGHPRPLILMVQQDVLGADSTPLRVGTVQVLPPGWPCRVHLCVSVCDV